MTAMERLMAVLPDGQTAAMVTSAHSRRYLTGFPSSAGLVLIMREKAYFLTDSRYSEAAARAITTAECREYTKVSETLAELFRLHGIKRVQIEAEQTTLAELGRWRRMLPETEWVTDGELDRHLAALRLVKTPQEMEKLRQAQQLTEFGFDHILSFIREGRTEREIALELEFVIRRQGAEGVSFDFIVVSGANSSLPHGVPTDKKVEAGDFVTMDFGAMVDGWHADMTRTVAVGQVSERQQEVYDTVLRAQKAALAVLSPYITGVQGDAAARDVIREAGYGAYFGHGTGHGVGVEIHEEPRLSPSAGDTLLPIGSVVTVEPGIYLPGQFGVRIEDMALITSDGCENLTASPKELIVL